MMMEVHEGARCTIRNGGLQCTKVQRLMPSNPSDDANPILDAVKVVLR